MERQLDRYITESTQRFRSEVEDTAVEDQPSSQRRTVDQEAELHAILQINGNGEVYQGVGDQEQEAQQLQRIIQSS